MKKLRNKIFLLLSIIFTVILLISFIGFNISIYNREYKYTVNKVKYIDKIINGEKYFLDDGNNFLLDVETYVVMFDRLGNIRRVLSFNSDNNISSKELDKIVKKNINNKEIDKLYFRDYIGVYYNSNLIIISNKLVRSYLISSIIFSLILFSILELLCLYISVIITKWLIKPVIDTFNKQEQFIYDASHELKTPLAIIMASYDEYIDCGEGKWLDNIKTETDRMDKLVKNLLELSKSGDINYDKKIDNLSKIVEIRALSFESLIYESSLKLDMDISDNIMFNCNSDKIQELVGILLDNAIKHSYKKSSIKIKLYRDKGEIILDVINHGKEIDVSEREKIFERFYRVDKSRNRSEGRYGLGLSIAKNIVINHNGSIKVLCEDGYTTFRVIFK